ncbi:MAG: hypothetical protein HQ515_02055 [Phycisphaeraceae bacterium]|nr:hypothetical protein [Phycisphaeraceae bacterium]
MKEQDPLREYIFRALEKGTEQERLAYLDSVQGEFCHDVEHIDVMNCDK